MNSGKSSRTLRLCLAAVILVMFTAPAFAVEIEYMKWTRPAESEILKALISQWNAKYPEIRVKFTETGWGNHHQQLDIRIAGGDAPDIFITTPQYIRRYVEQGHALVLSKFVNDKYMADYSPLTREWVYWKGQPYGIPFEADTSSILYNVDYFKQIGVKAPEVVHNAWTWAEWEDIGKKLRDNTKADYGFTGPFGKSAGDPHLLHSFGGSFLTADLSSPNVNNPSVIQGLKMQKRWYDERLEPISALFAKPDSPHDLFASGRIGMYDWGAWMLDFVKDKSGGAFQVDLTFMPKGPFGYSGIPGGQVSVISSSTKHPNEAAKFVLWTHEAEQVIKISQAGFLPANVEILSKMVWTSWDSQMQKAKQSILNVMPIVFQEARHTNYYAMQQAYKEIMAEAMHGKISVEAAAQRLDKAIKELL